MDRSYVFDYLLFVLAPLITYLLSKIQLFAPQSKYFVVHDARPTPADLIISTKYFEIYAPHNPIVALVVSLSVLSILHLGYLIYAIRQPPVSVKLPWKTEVAANTTLKIKAVLARRNITLRGVNSVIQSQLPELSLYRVPLTESDTVASDTQAREEIELEELKFPRSTRVRDNVPLSPKRDAYARQHKAEKDDTDWKTVFCEEWTDRLDGDGGNGVESWSPT